MNPRRTGVLVVLTAVACCVIPAIRTSHVADAAPKLIPHMALQVQAETTGQPIKRRVGGTAPVVAWTPVVSTSANCPNTGPSSVTCVAPSVANSIVVGIAVQGGNPGDTILVIMGGRAQCTFTNTPVFGDIVAPGAGGCLDVGPTGGSIQCNADTLGKIDQVIDGSNAYVSLRIALGRVVNAGCFDPATVPAYIQANQTPAPVSSVNSKTGAVVLSASDVGASTFSGSYTDLTNKPTIPTTTSQLTNNSGFLTAPVVNGSLANSTVTINGVTIALGSSGTIPIGGSGTVTSFAAPSASWPSWLVPTVSTATTTPSLAVTASAIPNSALANSSVTVGGATCTLGSTCTPSHPIAWYTSAGVVSGVTKCWRGAVTTINGTGTLDYSSAAFASAPTLQLTSAAGAATAAGMTNTAYFNKTATGATVVTTAPATISLLGALSLTLTTGNVVVDATACGP